MREVLGVWKNLKPYFLIMFEFVAKQIFLPPSTSNLSADQAPSNPDNCREQKKIAMLRLTTLEAYEVDVAGRMQNLPA